MNRNFSANHVKIAVIVIALAVAVSCTAAGTLAAFSATYTWTSDPASAREMEFFDTVYSLEMFDDGTVAVGDSGAVVLAGEDFGEHEVEWSFSSLNAEVIPIVFFVRDAAGTVTAYSAYDFSALGAYYAEFAEGEFMSVADISEDPVGIAAKLGIGETLHWAWFDVFYEDSAGAVPAQGSEIDAYKAYCMSVCSSGYVFDERIADWLNEVKSHAFVVGTEGEDLKLRSFEIDVEKKCADGLIMYGDDIATVENGGLFMTVDTASALKEGYTLWVLVPATYATAENEALLDGIAFEKGGAYALSGAAESAELASPADGGARVLYKLPVSAKGSRRAEISVTVSATVYF